jgi:hypothetical protein
MNSLVGRSGGTCAAAATLAVAMPHGASQSGSRGHPQGWRDVDFAAVRGHPIATLMAPPP